MSQDLLFLATLCLNPQSVLIVRLLILYLLVLKEQKAHDIGHKLAVTRNR